MTGDTDNSVAGVLCPFDLTVDVIDRLLNFEIADDPVYSGLEMQAFDGPEYGTGVLAFLTRRDEAAQRLPTSPGYASIRWSFRWAAASAAGSRPRLTRPASTQ